MERGPYQSCRSCDSMGQMEHWEEGRRLLSGRYRFVRRLGAGGLADAFEVFDEAASAVRCLKLLRRELEPEVHWLRREFDLLRGLHHPNLVEVHDFGRARTGEGETTPRAFLTTTLVRGMTLESALDRGTSWSAVKTAFADGLRGLAYLHRVGMRHGDFKEANLMLESERGRGMLIDLSCADRLTSRASGAGTPRYMAPELQAGRSVDAQADVFAVGVTLAQMADRLSDGGQLKSLAVRLCQADPAARPHGIEAVLEALDEDPHTQAYVPVASPTFLGRSSELREVLSLADNVLHGSHGARIVEILGPPGIGRSRFLREVKWSLTSLLDVVEGYAEQPQAIHALLTRATGLTLPVTNLAALQAINALANRTSALALVLDDSDQLDPDQRELFNVLLRTTEARHPLLIIHTAKQSSFEQDELQLSIRLDALSRDHVSQWLATCGYEAKHFYEKIGGCPANIERGIRALHHGTPLTELEGVVAEGRLASSVPPPDCKRLFALLALAHAPLPTEALLRLAEVPSLPDTFFDLGVQKTTQGWALTAKPPQELVSRWIGEQELQDMHAKLASHALELAPAAGSAGFAQAAWHLFNSGQLARALALFESKKPQRDLLPRPWVKLAERVPSDSPSAPSAAKTLLLAGEPSRALHVLGPSARQQSAEVSLIRAECQLELGETQACLSTLEQEDFGDSEQRSRAQLLKARAALRLGNNEQAAACAEEGLAIQPPTKERGELHECAGVAALYLGKYDEAKEQLSHAAQLGSSALDPKRLFRAVSYEAILAFRQGDMAKAMAGYRRAHAIAEENGIVDQLARTSLNLGSALHQEASYAEALAQYERGERLARVLGQRDLLLVFACNSAKLHADLFDLDRAETQATRLRTRADQEGARFFCAAADTVLAEVQEGRRNLAESYRLHAQAKQTLAELGAHREVLEEELELSRVAVARGYVAEARDHLATAQRQELPPDIDVKSMIVRADLARTENDNARAHSLLTNAQRKAEKCHQPSLLALVLARLVRTTTDLGLESEADAARRALFVLWAEMVRGLSPLSRNAFYSKPERSQLVESASGITATSPPEPRTAVEPESSHPAGARLGMLERLIGAFRKLNSSLEFSDLVAFAVDEAIALTGAERGYLLLASAAGAFNVAVARNMDRAALSEEEESVSRTIALDVIRCEQPLVTVDAQADNRFKSNTSVHAMRLRSVMAVPIRSPDGVLGALYLDNRYAHARFSEGQVDLLMAFGDQVALALRNAQQLDQLKKQTDQLRQANAAVKALATGQALEIERLEEEVKRQRASLDYRFDYSTIIGRSTSLRRVLTTLDRVIDSPLSVLIGGESGTGKELIARAIHAGQRKDKPFIGLNCGALPASVLESELFGHVKGAFTGADKDRQGLIVAAHGGTLFLDELGEMPLETQVKLLRVLQEREVRAVGSERSVAVDFRLVSATNRDLRLEVQRGRFREDLFYRVGVVEVVLPPLRERKDDLPELVTFLLERAAKELNRPQPRLDVSALRKLYDYDWPGNIRQLQNVVTRALVLCDGSVLGPSDIELPAGSGSVAPGTAKRRPYRTAPEPGERERMLEALRITHWNVARAADHLVMPRATFYRRLKLYKLDRAR